MKSKSLRILLATLLFTLVQSANAFTLNYDSTNKKILGAWTTSTVTFDYNFSNCPASVSVSTLTAAVQSALDVWNGVPSSSLELKLGTAVTTTAAAAKAQTTAGNPVIVCDTAYTADTGLDGNFSPAAASVGAVDANWHIDYAVLYLNAEVGKTDIISNIPTSILSLLMAHEIGHSIGFGHSSDTNALMYFDASLKTTLNLSKDDVDGVTYLYPRNELGGSGVFGCSTIAAAGSTLGKSKHDDDGPSGPVSQNQIEFMLLLFSFWVISRVRISKDPQAN